MRRLIDLSHPLVHGAANFPWDPKLIVHMHNTVETIGYNITQICMSSHQGTHLDAPKHFYNNGTTIDQMPLELFYGPACLVDLAPGTALRPRQPITVEMLEPFAERFTVGAKIVYRTGWDKEFGTQRFFSEFPSLTLEAARWIADKRIGLLGMDTPTPSTDWKECHLTLLATGIEIVIVEGLTQLEKLKDYFTFIGFPLKFIGIDGSPIRAVALLE
jgi:arylformamidase